MKSPVKPVDSKLDKGVLFTKILFVLVFEYTSVINFVVQNAEKAIAPRISTLKVRAHFSTRLLKHLFLNDFNFMLYPAHVRVGRETLGT